MLKEGEVERLRQIREKIEKVHDISNNFSQLRAESFDAYWRILFEIKRAMRNFDNDIHYLARLMAREFLVAHHPELVSINLDISSKPEGASGPDIDMQVPGGLRLVGEIKTTIASSTADFQANQRKSIMNDFHKLANEEAKFKYLFVTDKGAWDIIRRRYLGELKGAKLVLLPEAIKDEGFICDSLLSTDKPIVENHIVLNKVQDDEPRRTPLKEEIQKCIMDMVNERVRESGESEVTIRSGDVVQKHKKFRNRYPSICNAMKHLDRSSYNVRILNQRGKTGANFSVTYEIDTKGDSPSHP